jgi:hypothetical protein
MDDFLVDFSNTIEDAAPRLRAVPAERAARPMEGGWSAQQIVGHLIDSAANNHQRFVRAQFTDHLDFPGYEQEQWVLAQRYESEPWPRLLDLWLAYNRHLAHVVAASHPRHWRCRAPAIAWTVSPGRRCQRMNRLLWSI